MSDSSNEVVLSIPAKADPLPPQILGVTRKGNAAELSIQLPASDESGQALAALPPLEVYADTKSLLGRIEEFLGLDTKVTVAPTPDQIGQQLAVEVPNLAWGTKFYFRARFA
jgi:hypothetical protein